MARPRRSYQDPKPLLEKYIQETREDLGRAPSQRDAEYWNAGEGGPKVPRRVLRKTYKEVISNG